MLSRGYIVRAKIHLREIGDFVSGSLKTKYSCIRIVKTCRRDERKQQGGSAKTCHMAESENLRPMPGVILPACDDPARY